MYKVALCKDEAHCSAELETACRDIFDKLKPPVLKMGGFSNLSTYATLPNRSPCARTDNSCSQNLSVEISSSSPVGSRRRMFS